ncbi:uncharacterized protein Z519_05298 [Cladophialophora bantiana CBS 173.52]|uniref:Uncharacterized protein n=1 Tax=Cladophialophora bantiana (strain ATCC 10958 / CBS 173.52 / CDC B-1940 / NIH 8579) TaxID=1442370 RepID=A0A0D2HL57_CLAB1|nr:uncharacterized protein Z519_05298 [Cladophialophora bantiana CBS 173.52]KIW93983.1 hypothetical protein Z519_05298 [Cladophialophora bantiana CBS 173.52]
MPFASRPASLLVEDNGNLVGTWKVFQISSISKRVLAWIGVPSLTGVAIRSALENLNQHVFMVESNGKDFSGALLVKVLGCHRMFQRLCGRVVGFLRFQPAQNRQTNTAINLEEGLGDTDMTEQGEVKAWRTVTSCFLDFRGKSMPIKASQSLTSYRLDSSRPAVAVVVADAVGCLSEKSNALDAQGDSKANALHRAAWKGKEEVVSDLNQKVDQYAADKYVQLPIHLAAERGHVNVVKALMVKSTDIRDASVMNRLRYIARLGALQTALLIAATLSYLPVVSLLLQRGAKVNAKDKRGRTPMAREARNGDDEVLKAFLQHGDIEINSIDELGQTSLHLASWYGHTRAVKLLLKHPAVDRNATDSFGRTPVFMQACMVIST